MAGMFDSLDFLVQGVEAIPGLVQAGMDAVQVAAYTTKLVGQVKEMRAQNRAPTTQEWDGLNAEIATDRKRLHAP